MPCAVSCLASVSFLQRDAKRPPPPPPPKSRGSGAPAPPHPSQPLRHRAVGSRVTGRGARGWRRDAAPRAWSLGSDRRAPVSASRPPTPLPSAPGCRLEPGCPTRGRPWAPRAPRTWAAPPCDPAWPPRAWSPPASEQRPRPARARPRARASRCPPPPRGAAGKRGWGWGVSSEEGADAGPAGTG